MFCPNLSDPEIKRKFESLKSVYPEGAYYLWDKYQGEVPAKYYNLPAYSSKSINNLTPEELQTVQNTLENKLIIEQDTDLAFKSGQAYHYLNSKDAARMSSLVGKHKEYPKEFKVTKKVTKYERKGLDFKSYNVYKDFIYVKTNNNKKSNLYNIIDKETGELVQEKVRVIHLSKDVKSKIADSYGLEHRPTKIFNANRSVAFALYRQKPSKAKYIAQAKKYLYDAIKFLNPNESNLTINLSQIEKMLDSFPEEMWDYINTTYSPEDSTNINASTSLQNNISIKLPKLGLIKEVEKITGLPILNQSFKNYDRSGKLKKVLRVEWGGPVTIDATLTKKQLHAAIGYYLKDKGYFKTTSEQENVRKYAEHNNINPEELAELVFGDFAKALDNVAWNMSGNSDSIEVSKWRESIRNYEWQSVELFAKPYDQFNANAKNRIIEKFKDTKLSNGISHLDYFFTGKFNWLNINFNNISGQYYLADNETLAPVGVSYKTAGIQNVFQMANYRKPKAGENFLKEEEVFNRLAAILHEPMHALHALSYGSKEELALRKSFEDLAKTEFGKQMLTQAFGDQYNNKSITPDILYKEFTAFATQLILYPKEWINQTNLRSNDILDFIEKIQNLQDKTYTETIKTIEKIGEQETTVTTEEKLKLDFLQKLYNYIVSALNRVIPISKQFFKLIPSTNLVTQKIVEDVFGEVERTQERTLELPKSIVRSKQEFLDAMDEFKNAIQGLMQTDASMFSSDNVRNFFQRTESFAQESNSIKPRVSEVFKFNTELNKIGSEQQFSEYLDTLLPGGTIQYRGDQKGLSEFRYSTPTEESRRTGKVHKLGSGVYTTPNQSLAQEYAKSNNGEVYPVLVSKGLTYNTRMDFLQAVADSLSIESIPTESQVDKFVKDQQDLGNSITVKELGESVSSVKDSILLNSPKVIEGFKQFVSKPSENVMYSRSGNREAIINSLLTEDKFKDLLLKTFNLQLTGNPVTNRQLVRNYVWENVKSNLNYNGQFSINGDTISILPSTNVTFDQSKGIAAAYTNQLNKAHFSNVLGDSFKYKLVEGVPSIVYEPSSSLLNLVASAVSIDQQREAELVAQLEAEVALISIAENAKAEQIGLLEKLASANEAVIDGEIYPLDNSVFDSRISLMRWTSRSTTQKFGKLLDKLSERFPGVTWEWDTSIDNPGKVDLNSGKILVNPSLINEDTPWHEFGHIVVRMIKQSNPELFNSLKKDVQRLHELAPQISSQSYVEELYPEYIGTDLLWEEAIVTELGRQSVDVYEKAAEYKNSESLFQKIKNWINTLINDMLGKTADLTNITTISELADILAGTEVKFEQFKNQESENAVSEFMFSRVLNESQRDLLISQIKTPEGTTDYTEWGAKLKDLTSKIDIEEFRKLIYTNKFLGVDSITLDTAKRALSRIGDIITPEDVAEAVLDLAEFYQYGAFYLSRLEANMKLIEEENKLPIAKQLSIFHNSYKQALAFESYFKELQKLFKVGTNLPTSLEEKRLTKQVDFLANAFNINSAITQIKNRHLDRIEQPVAKILSENFKESTEKLQADFNKEIERLTKLNTNGKFTKKIKNLEKQRDELSATEENIIKFFKEKVNTTWLPQGLRWADTNVTSNDPAINIVANFISDVINDARAELVPVGNVWQDLMSEMSKIEGNFTGTFINSENFFKPYYRVSEEYEVIDGELVKGKKVLVLNSPGKIQELQNKFTELNYIISTSEDELKRNEAEDELKKLYEEYTERPFTDEYYELQKLLPEKVRAIRQEKFDLISALHETLLMEDDANSEQTVYRLKLANKELYDLERLYDDLGNLKTGEDREIAEAIIQWKESRREAASIVYEISEESKGTYERELAKRKLIRDTNIANALTQEDKDLAIKAYNNWTSVYSRTVYSEEFYLERESILGEIHKLLGKSTDTKVDTLYKEIFNALRGRKDKNNQYDARDVSPELARTLRIKEEAIEEAKKSIKKSPLSAEDRQKFFSLLQQLEDLQTSVPTEHYKDTVDSIKESLRSQVINEKPGLDILSVEKEVESRFRNSQWYKDNHISKVRWNKDTEEMQTVMEPLFMWRVTAPKNPKYILKEQPSFYWFKAKVNPQFKNPKYRPGEVTFKEITAGTYYNSGYDQLSPSQKALLGKIRDAHYATQEGIYSRDKLYDKIPALEKELGQAVMDVRKLKEGPLKSLFSKVRNVITFNTENDPRAESEGIADQTDVFGNDLDKSARRIFLRHSRALPLEEQSYDIMAAMASYAAAAVKFKTIRKYQSSLLSTEEVLKTLSGSESTRSKLIQSMMDRVVYGRSRNKLDSRAGKLINSISAGVSKTASFAALGLNIKSVPKNWFNGYFTSWSQMQFNGLTKNDFAKAHKDTFGLSKEYFTEFAQFGKKSLKLQLVDYFAGLQHDPFSDAKDVSNVGLRKYGKLWKSINSIRGYSEFDISANIVFAFLNKHRVPLKDSTQTIPLKEAFVSKDGVITLKDDVDVSKEFIAHVRREIQDASFRSQGAYDLIAQPEAIKFAAVRMTLWMKRFVVQHLKANWEGDTIHYGAGIRTVGAHRALINVLKDLYSTKSFAGISSHDKAGLLQLGKTYAGYIVLANMIKAMSLIGNCEDDGVADWKDYICFYAKSINSEVEGIFTIWGMNEFLNTYYQEKANGVSIMEKIGATIAGPTSVISKWWDSDLWTTDPYYKYKPNSTKIDWDKTHPLLAGKPGLQVLGYKVLGATGLSIDPTTTEYDNRRFNSYMPKTYTKQLSTEFKEKYEGVKEKKSKTPLGQIKKQYKKEVLEIKKEIIQARKKGEDDSYLFEKLKKAQENAIKATQNLSKSKLNEYSIDVLPMPFWKRKGMDLEEMSEDSLD